MIRGLFDQQTVYGLLRTGLDEIAVAHKRISRRVAGADIPLAGDGFDAQLRRQVDGVEELKAAEEAKMNLERDMTQLANNQLRYEAAARLLQKAYSGIRTAIRDRG